VHDVSFDVGSGEVVGLLGPNGAGKTTCFYMIVGLVAADGGDPDLDGAETADPLADPPPRASWVCPTCRRKRRCSAS
jgi:ABC-type lipopolysaccharide export system ATPase subunit